MEEQCKLCQYIDVRTWGRGRLGEKKTANFGYRFLCRIGPPTVVATSSTATQWGEVYAEWPTVNPEQDWCGELVPAGEGE